MSSFCSADCENCNFKNGCKGCSETDGCPFGEKCIAAQYIKAGGIEEYHCFKNQLKDEINNILRFMELPETNELFELKGEFVNLEYEMLNGKKEKLLNDNKIYLGCQIEFADMGVCLGVVADASFILVCSYSVNGSEPELLMLKRR